MLGQYSVFQGQGGQKLNRKLRVEPQSISKAQETDLDSWGKEEPLNITHFLFYPGNATYLSFSLGIMLPLKEKFNDQLLIIHKYKRFLVRNRIFPRFLTLSTDSDCMEP